MSTRKKQVCIIGLGHFGRELALTLAGHCEVLAIDCDERRVNEIADLVHRASTLDARNETALTSVIPPDIDEAIVSVGENLESSILSTLYLKRLGVPKVRTKAVSDDHATVLLQVGADEVIFPERDMARRIGAHIMNPNLVDFVPLGSEYEVMEVIAPEGFHGHTLRELNLRARYEAVVFAINRPGGQQTEFLPGPDSRVESGDLLIMIGRREDLCKIQ